MCFWQNAVLFIMYKTDHLWPNQYKKIYKNRETISGSRKQAAVYA